MKITVGMKYIKQFFKQPIGMLATLIWVTVLATTLLTSNTAWAQMKCLPAVYQQRNATDIYLIRFTKVAYEPMSGDEYAGARMDTRGARFEVLKVYAGDVAALKDVQHAMLEIRCNGKSQISCSILEEDNYPFRVGQMLLVYTSPKDGLVTLSSGPCPPTWQRMDGDIPLLKFERNNKPLWESKAWKEYRELIRIVDPDNHDLEMSEGELDDLKAENESLEREDIDGNIDSEEAEEVLNESMSDDVEDAVIDLDAPVELRDWKE